MKRIISFLTTLSTALILYVTPDVFGYVTGNAITESATYTYNELGKLIDVDSAVQYGYDGLAKRIKKTESGNTLVYSYLGEQLLCEYDDSTSLYLDNVYFEGQLISRVTDNGATTNAVFAHLNHLESPVAFTDNVAAVIWPEQVGGLPYEVHAYEPFGADFDDLGSPIMSSQDVRYTGKLFDASTGKHYFNARYLNAITDTASPELPPRFLSPDIVIGSPGNPQGWNRYASCLNNPVKYVDPDGKAVLNITREQAEKPYSSYLPSGTPGFIRTIVEFVESGPSLEPLPMGMAATATKRVGTKILSKIGEKVKQILPEQWHHFATNKSKTYTPRLEKIAKKFGLDLEDIWNKEMLPHQGRHPNLYHEFVESGMEQAAREAGSDANKFLKLIDTYVKEPVRQNPDLLRKSGWE